MTARFTAPRATYRLQLHPGFGFDRAIEVLDYVAELGASHCYFAPYLSSAPESFHGYDVVDPTSIRADLGGEDGHRRLCEAMRERGLEHMIDVVPNHMGIESEHNRWWWDVLARGRESEYEPFFDIAWERDPEHKLVLAILPFTEAEALESGYVQLEPAGEQGLKLRVGTRCLPLCEASLTALRGAELESINRSPRALSRVLDQQHYRLTYYRTGIERLNYRRFLDIGSLAALRMEDPEVFRATHVRILEWVRDGKVSAIRVDHPDGLRDPEGYFGMLRNSAPGAWVVGEKVHAPGEWLPENWPLDGTTGYEFLNLMNGLFVQPQGLRALSRVWSEFRACEAPAFASVLSDSKDIALTSLLTPEVSRVAGMVAERAHRDQECADAKVAQAALIALLHALHIGRSYARPGQMLSHAERAELEQARARAAERTPGLDLALGELCSMLASGPADDLLLRFQQLSGAVMAKALEDTAFYRFLTLSSLNEIGGNPEQPCHSVRDFHQFCRRATVAQPLSLLCTSTHDTKRAEDTRLRINVLSELPEAWAEAVHVFRALNAPLRSALVDADTEYLLYQTLVGAWPISEQRLCAYMHKAVREAKLRTSWLAPEPEYEAAVSAFVRAVLGHADFLGALEQFLGRVLPRARFHSLAQTLLKVTCPGVPDIYQGTELWDTSLVDPDNRRPVDFAARTRMLRELKAGMSAEQILARMDEAYPKLWVLSQALRARRERPESLAPGAGYEPLPVLHDEREHIIAFMRGEDVLVVVPRFFDACAAEQRVALPTGSWRNRFTGEALPGGEHTVAALLARFPVALLVRD